MSYSLNISLPSMTNGFGSDGYQDLHRADIEDIRSEVGGDISGDLSGAEASFHDEALHFDPNLGLELVTK